MLILYTGLIFVFIIGGTSLIFIEFKNLARHYDKFYRERLKSLKETYDYTKSEDGRTVFLNRTLDKRISEIANLYEITKEMSTALVSLDIFQILAKFLRKGFSFRSSRLILINQKTQGIEKLYQVRGATPAEAKKVYGPKPKVYSLEPDEESANLAAHINKKREPILIDSFSRILDKKKGYLPKNIDSFLAVPLIVGEELVGVLSIENLPPEKFDNFLILSRQFILEMRKVRLYGRVQELAITDGLTGAYVRRHFTERLDEELKRSRRHKLSNSLLMLDIDHFKSTNDTYGHLVGDAVLNQLVGIVKANIRQIDLVGRYGGEEFFILLPETGREAAFVVAERIRNAVNEDRFKVYDEFTTISVSIGVATFPDDATGKKELIEKADQALYRAKNEGRNRVCAFS